MGTDIHVHAELLVGGEWLYYREIDIDRDYKLFSLMADVRNDRRNQFDGYVEPIDQPRGLPENISLMTKMHRDDFGEDGHSDSWLSYPEILQVIRFMKQVGTYILWGEWTPQIGRLFGNSWERWKDEPEGYPDEIKDIRWIFWFDS